MMRARGGTVDLSAAVLAIRLPISSTQGQIAHETNVVFTRPSNQLVRSQYDRRAAASRMLAPAESGSNRV